MKILFEKVYIISVMGPFLVKKMVICHKEKMNSLLDVHKL